MRELQWIRRRGGATCRLHRPGTRSGCVDSTVKVLAIAKPPRLLEPDTIRVLTVSVAAVGATPSLPTRPRIGVTGGVGSAGERAWYGGWMSDVSLGRTLVTAADLVSLDRASAAELSSVDAAARYARLSSLGEGGMGEVSLARDVVIGRDVAVKSVRKELEGDASVRKRFLREARVQGQLAHPSIVPVHDLGATSDGRLYFTMQRVRGRSLGELVDEGALTRHAALSAMSRICLAIDYAHAHGVVHRDLKPANLMLGDYGEVYVLDWGIAKLVEHGDVVPSGRSPSSDDGVSATRAGSMLGTPGHMPPEQVRGEAIDERSDVYALGACLFELLARTPLHEGKTFAALLASTLDGASARASERAPDADVPPELDAICVRATMLRPEDRYPTARAMHEAIERFLEGDRDVERRRVKSAEHASAAERLAAAAIDTGSTDARAEAMREIGRALALDPSNETAMRALVRLLTDPPRVLPPAVRAQMEAERDRGVLSARRYSSYLYLSTLAPIPVALAMGIRQWRWLAVVVAFALLGAAVTFYLTEQRTKTLRRNLVVACAVVGLLAASRMAGPFMVVPVLAMGVGVGLAMFPRPVPLAMTIASAASPIVLPLVLELLGVLPTSYVFEADRLCIHAQLASFPAVPTIVYLLLITIAPIAAVCVYLVRMRDRLLQAEERVRVQAWQLRHIVGGE
jgi:serine/threonine protein kinase